MNYQVKTENNYVITFRKPEIKHIETYKSEKNGK